MRSTFAILALIGCIVVANPAAASCTWEWICDESGDCANVPICDSTINIVPPQPPSITPIVPPSVRPVERLNIPPIGTDNCTQVRRQDAYGNWVWDTVCY